MTGTDPVEENKLDKIVVNPTGHPDTIRNARHSYPRKKKNNDGSGQKMKFEVGVGLVTKEEKVTRRIMGFGLGFEKIFATTSIKLPVSAYTLFVELHPLDGEQVHNRCFNGLHTVYDLKKWVFEVTQVPIDSYVLSYAEPGKAALTDQLRLLTMQESLDTRTLGLRSGAGGLAYLSRGIPGVHSVSDAGVTRLYLRLKCRATDRLLVGLPEYMRYRTVGHADPATLLHTSAPTWTFDQQSQQDGQQAGGNGPQGMAPTQSMRDRSASPVPGMAPPNAVAHQSSDARDQPGTLGFQGSLRPNQLPYERALLFDDRGLEMFNAAQVHGSSSEIARVYISLDEEPSKKLKVARNVLRHAPMGRR